ncbi:MAG TPA: 6-bladed beta-propeller [Longimicrobiaceae bacterium]|nr:6-bladed beta-propeller [Longimicrobiaceae bacterium]
MSTTARIRAAAPLLALALLAGAPLAAQPSVRLPAQDRPLAGTPATVFTIGREDGQSWEMLSNAERLAFDRNDNLYVLDRGNARVLVFDRNGRFVRQLGKKGDGPGEFQVPTSLTILNNGDLAVLDVGHQNITLFAPDGTVRRTAAWSPEWGIPVTQIDAHPAGGIVGTLRPMLRMDQARSGNMPSMTQTIARIPLEARAEPVRLFEIPDASRSNSQVSEGGNQRQFRMRLGGPEFSALTLWGVLPDGGTALSHTSLYTIKVQDAAGRTIRFLQRPVPVRRVTEADRDRARQRAREQMRSGAGAIMIVRGGGGAGAPRTQQPSEQMIQERLREMEFADTMRVLQGLAIAPSGKIWVERTPQNPGDPGPIDLVTVRGDYLGTITGLRMPRAISASGRVAYVERDDLGVERVVVKQLPAAWR